MRVRAAFDRPAYDGRGRTMGGKIVKGNMEARQDSQLNKAHDLEFLTINT